jgi:hypothetical protein
VTRAVGRARGCGVTGRCGCGTGWRRARGGGKGGSVLVLGEYWLSVYVWKEGRDGRGAHLGGS